MHPPAERKTWVQNGYFLSILGLHPKICDFSRKSKENLRVPKENFGASCEKKSA